MLAPPWRLVRAGRAGRGAGPDVREATFALPDGTVRAGDVEVHLRASDFVRHGHLHDPAYARVVLHLVWHDDREDCGTPTDLGNGLARTLAVGALLGGGDAGVARLRALIAQGPAGAAPCGDAAGRLGRDGVEAELRRAGQRRLAERVWRAGALAAEVGWDGAWAQLLERALAKSAGRVARRADAGLAGRVTSSLGTVERGDEPLQRLAAVARDGDVRALMALLRDASAQADGGGALGAGRAGEVGWNAVLPLLAALAQAYGDVALARGTARLAAEWPGPAQAYGKTRALAALLEGADASESGGRGAVGTRSRMHATRHSAGGALRAQGLLHTQELWCMRGGCGVCPFSVREGSKS